jgi:hypothetical protein
MSALKESLKEADKGKKKPRRKKAS